MRFGDRTVLNGEKCIHFARVSEVITMHETAAIWFRNQLSMFEYQFSKCELCGILRNNEKQMHFLVLKIHSCIQIDEYKLNSLLITSF